MTTNVQFDFVENVSNHNDVLSIAISPNLRLAAGVWTIPSASSLVIARINCLKHVLSLMAEKWPGSDLWLVAGHKSFQPDNRVTRHHRLWKSLLKAGVVLPTGVFVEESAQQSGKGVRFFGAVRCDSIQIEAIHGVMRAAQAAVVIVGEQKSDEIIPRIVNRGWSLLNTKPPEELLEAVCGCLGLVIDIYGEFDDSDVSVAAIGKKEVLIALDM